MNWVRLIQSSFQTNWSESNEKGETKMLVAIIFMKYFQRLFNHAYIDKKYLYNSIWSLDLCYWRTIKWVNNVNDGYDLKYFCDLNFGPFSIEWWYFVFRKVICATSTTLIAFDGFSSWPNPMYKISRIQTCGVFACSLAHSECDSYTELQINTHTHTHMCVHIQSNVCV